MILEADDLPGCVSWWPEAAEVLAQWKQDQGDRKADGVYMAKQRKLALDYYRKNREAINAKRRATRPSRAKRKVS